MKEKKMREFTDEEKKVTQKILDGRNVELEHLKLMVEYNTFMLDKMLYSNYLEKRRAFKLQTEEYEVEIVELAKSIEITSKQMTEGVEIVENDSQNDEVPGMVG